MSAAPAVNGDNKCDEHSHAPANGVIHRSSGDEGQPEGNIHPDFALQGHHSQQQRQHQFLQDHRMASQDDAAAHNAHAAAHQGQDASMPQQAAAPAASEPRSSHDGRRSLSRDISLAPSSTPPAAMAAAHAAAAAAAKPAAELAMPAVNWTPADTPDLAPPGGAQAPMASPLTSPLMDIALFTGSPAQRAHARSGAAAATGAGAAGSGATTPGSEQLLFAPREHCDAPGGTPRDVRHTFDVPGAGANTGSRLQVWRATIVDVLSACQRT